jgi:hypothetical protein
MSRPMSKSVSIHPYFKVNAGQMEAARNILTTFVEKTKTEAGCLYYDFTVNGDTVFCREAYTDGEAALAHLSNVSEPLGDMLKIAELVRLELHGPAAELDRLRGPLEQLPVQWFIYETGLGR